MKVVQNKEIVMKIANESIFGELLFNEDYGGEFDLQKIIAAARASGKHDVFTCWHSEEWLALDPEKRYRNDMHPILSVIPIDEKLEQTLADWQQKHGRPMIVIACNWADFEGNPAYSD